MKRETGFIVKPNGSYISFTPFEVTMSTTYGEGVTVELNGDLINGVDLVDTVMPKIDRVIFAPPATIVYWTDKSKTVVKCKEGDQYDEKLGLGLCFLKKFTGNKSRTLDEIVKGKCFRGKDKVPNGSDN